MLGISLHPVQDFYAHTSSLALRGTKIPVWLNLREHDFLYGGDHEGDINPYDGRHTIALGHTPAGPPLQLSTRGRSLLGGRKGDDDPASIDYSLETIKPEPAGASATRPLTGLACENYFATVDDLEQVDETNELNNTEIIGAVIC